MQLLHAEVEQKARQRRHLMRPRRRVVDGVHCSVPDRDPATPIIPSIHPDSSQPVVQSRARAATRKAAYAPPPAASRV